MKQGSIAVIKHSQLIEQSLMTFKHQKLCQEDWDYCEDWYYIRKNKHLPIHMERMRMVNSGMDGAEVARRHGVTPASVRCSVMRGIRTMNERIQQLPEYKLAQLLEQ